MSHNHLIVDFKKIRDDAERLQRARVRLKREDRLTEKYTRSMNDSKYDHSLRNKVIKELANDVETYSIAIEEDFKRASDYKDSIQREFRHYAWVITMKTIWNTIVGTIKGTFGN